MAIETATLPQTVEGIKVTTFADLIGILPERISYRMNVWIADKLARFGVTTDNLIFLVELDGEPSVDLRTYFDELVKPLGIAATVSESWKNSKFAAMRLYNDGRLIIDKKTSAYKELPASTRTAPIITVDTLRSKLPKTIEWKCTLWLTGGIVKNGWSANDVDIIIFEPQGDVRIYARIRDFFTKMLGWKTDVGTKVMPEREPVYLFKLYENGLLCLS